MTASTKSEESYKYYHKIVLFLVVLGAITGLASHAIDTAIT